MVVGQRVAVTIEKIAHGGHFIARHEGAVIFVRHAIPGEECTIEISSVGSSFNRGDVVSVEKASVDRVSPPCSYAHRLGCGGCDFQHIEISAQRKLKSDVIREQFARIAKMEIDVEVEEVGPALGWRTRATASVTKSGKIGFISARSHNVIAIDNCLITAPGIEFSALSKKQWQTGAKIDLATSSTGESFVTGDVTELMHEKVGDRVLEVSNDSFWQSHVNAPQVLTEIVSEYANVQSGEHVLDLYGGVGLFTSALIDAVGPTGRIDLVEGSKSATADAKKNFSAHSNVNIVTASVERAITRIDGGDVVILDPPREGAGKEVISELARISPRAIVYVACDPAALARDTTYLQEVGYSLKKMRAFDLFPMTHHIETVALYEHNKVS
ncbi:MAG: TRAM domain-containing protein [Actinobacteria bacterium]|nr:TRAM domain-containing protein [Actinomycetota bacterium]